MNGSAWLIAAGAALAACLAAGCGGPAAPHAGATAGPGGAPTVGPPRRSWRLVPLAAASSQRPPAPDLAAYFRRGVDARVDAPAGQPVWLALRLPAGPEAALLTFEPLGGKGRLTVQASDDSTDGRDGAWQPLAEREAVPNDGVLQKCEFPPRGRPRWVRLTLAPTEDPPKPLALRDLGLYTLDPGGANDYWVSTGASIQRQSVRHTAFKALVRARFGYDPVLFNTAVGGWTTADLRRELPRILADHPHARYVTIHIGGNNVSQRRPWPGGADAMRDDLVAILGMVRDAGKVPIVARLSYRAYRGEKPVPPEENGSGPYLTAIHDPLIRQYCPAFYDEAAARGVVDPYTWFRDHPDELAGDGIHVNPKGEASWNRLWAEQAGPVVYGAAEAPAPHTP